MSPGRRGRNTSPRSACAAIIFCEHTRDFGMKSDAPHSFWGIAGATERHADPPNRTQCGPSIRWGDAAPTTAVIRPSDGVRAHNRRRCAWDQERHLRQEPSVADSACYRRRMPKRCRQLCSFGRGGRHVCAGSNYLVPVELCATSWVRAILPQRVHRRRLFR